MSKSPYLSNPNILAHPDRIVQKVELDMTTQDSYLAGSPISAEGKLANDASAIGILLYDVHKAIGGRTGVVVIFGRIKQDVAAEHSGITISAEAKAALIDITFTGDGCRMGGVGLSALPEGYPYKEGVSIEWDGNTEGREHTAAMGMEFYWVSPEILTDEEIKNGKVVSNDGNVEEIAKYWDQFVSGGNVTEDATLTSSVAVVRKANAEVAGVVFSTPGVYFMRMNLGGMVGFISKFSNETIHTMAPEFLPAGVGGGVQVVTLTASGSGALDTSSHTGAEIREMAKKGTVIAEIKATGMDGLAVFDGSFIAPDYGMDYVAFHTIMMNENMFSVSYFFIESDSTTVTQKSVKQST